MNHGDGCAPVALPAHSPILQAEGHRPPAKSALLGNLLELLLGLGTAQPIVFTGVHQYAVLRDKGQALRALDLFNGMYHLDNGQVVLGRKLEVPLVVRRDTHNGARAVIGQDIVSHPDGHPLAVVGIDGEASGGNPMLFDRAQVAGLASFLLLLQ